MSITNMDENNVWSVILQVVGGSEHTLRAKLTLSHEFHGTMPIVLFWLNV